MAMLASSCGLAQPRVDGQDAQCLHSFVVLNGVVLLCLQLSFKTLLKLLFL